MTENTADGPRLALRTGREGQLDDVVVQRVSTFRAEVMSGDLLWLCCYLPDTGVEGDRIAFEVSAHGNQLRVRVTEHPAGHVPVE